MMVNMHGRTQGRYLGTISLNSSIFSLPAGVSPMLTSMKTIGRCVEVIAVRREEPEPASATPRTVRVRAPLRLPFTSHTASLSL